VFDLSKIQFEIELLDDNAPTGFWGSGLRGGYGDILKHQVQKAIRAAGGFSNLLELILLGELLHIGDSSRSNSY
jgi:hypothetical protein